MRHVQDVRLDARFCCPPGHFVDRVCGAGQDMAAGPVVRRDDQLTARVQREGGVRVGGQADHRGPAGAWHGEHGGALRHERGRVGLGQAARPDQAGDLAHAMPDGRGGPHPQAVQPAQRGQRRLDDGGLGPRARPVLPGGRGGRLSGEQQDHPARGAVRGEQPGTRGQLAGSQAGQQPGGLPGEPGQLVLAGRHHRDPDGAAGGLAAQLAGEVTELAVGHTCGRLGYRGQLRRHRLPVRAAEREDLGPRRAGHRPRAERPGAGTGGLGLACGLGLASRLGLAGVRDGAGVLREDCLVGLAAQHHVHVAARRVQRADRGQPCAGRPGFGRPGHAQHGVLVGEHRVRAGTAGDRRQHPGVHRQGRLDQPGRTCGGLGVPDIGLDRAEDGRGRRASPDGGQRDELGQVTVRGAAPVSLDELDVGRIDPGPVVGTLEGQQLAVRVRGQHIPQAGGRDAPADDLRVDGHVGAPGVGRPHQGQHPAPLAGQEPGRAGVVDPHPPAGQDAGLGQGTELEGVQADVDPAGQDEVQLARGEQGGRTGHREQRRGMGGVHRLAPATETEMAADAVGDRPGLAAGQGLAADVGHRGEGCGGVAQGPGPLGGRDIPGRQRGGQHGADERPPGPQRGRAGDLTGQRVPDDHPGPVPGQPLPAGEAGVGERPACRLQGQPVRRVGGQERALADTETGAVELPPLEQGGPGDGSAGPPGQARIVAAARVRDRAEPAGRQPPERAPPGQGALEEGQRVVSVRESAG